MNTAHYWINTRLIMMNDMFGIELFVAFSDGLLFDSIS